MSDDSKHGPKMGPKTIGVRGPDEREIDADASADEQAAAGALARALDGEGSPDVPDDALQAAALLRYGATGGGLRPEAKVAIRDQLLEELSARARPVSPRWRRWLPPAGGLAAVAGAAAIAALLLSPAPVTPRDPAPLPRPELALLEAQSRATRLDGPAFDELRREMTSYRHRVYTAMIEHYESEGPQATYRPQARQPEDPTR